MAKTPKPIAGHTVRIPAAEPNRQPSVEEIERTSRRIASWYVRIDGKYFDAEDPRSKHSQEDVRQASVFRLQDHYPEELLSEGLLNEAFELSFNKRCLDRTLNVPTWNGAVMCMPQEPNRMVWDKGMVTINSWSAPSYRSLGETEADPGTVWELLSFVFSSEAERDTFLNWLSWNLQNEAEKPTWGPLLYSASKGTGKSTLCDVAMKLFGEANSMRQNGVDKLTGRFNREVLTSKLVVCEELEIAAGTKVGNALKTYMTEKSVVTEAKGRELTRIDQCMACIFTTNILPLWIEENDRRYWVAEIEHEGRTGGERASEFQELVGNTYAYLDHDVHVARLYNWLMQRNLPEGFSCKAFDPANYQTAIMERIFGNNGRTVNDRLAELLDECGANAIPEADVTGLVTGELRASISSTKHLMTELGWRKYKVKWGSKDYARALWVRPGYHVENGRLHAPDGTAEKLFEREAGQDVLLGGPSAERAIDEPLGDAPVPMPEIGEEEIY